MKKITEQLTINTLKRINNSYYGNPAWRIEATRENGETIIGRTASDAAMGYFLSSNHEGKQFLLTYHETKTGNIIFDYIDKTEE